MEEQVLKDKNIYPDNNVIEEYLNKKDYSLFIKFINETKSLNLSIEWRYYNDGKVWLGKILNKNKNLGWLSIWNNGIKITVYFTDKTKEGFKKLNINDQIKSSIDLEHTGKLIPVLNLIENDNVLNNVITILKYKMTLK